MQAVGDADLAPTKQPKRNRSKQTEPGAKGIEKGRKEAEPFRRTRETRPLPQQKKAKTYKKTLTHAPKHPTSSFARCLQPELEGGASARTNLNRYAVGASSPLGLINPLDSAAGRTS